MTEDYFSVEKLLERDIPNTLTDIYQIQSNTSDRSVKILEIGKFKKEEVPIVPILHMKLGTFFCEMMSYTISDDELINDSCLKMIGFLIQIDKKIIASLDFVFCPNEQKLERKKKSNNINGFFQIVLTRRKQGNNVASIIKTFQEYPGREESVHLLATTLIEDVIKII